MDIIKDYAHGYTLIRIWMVLRPVTESASVSGLTRRVHLNLDCVMLSTQYTYMESVATLIFGRISLLPCQLRPNV